MITIKITEENLKRLMKENPILNIKNGNEIYFKKILKGGLKEKK